MNYKELNFKEISDKTLDILIKGAFLTTTHDGKLNTMTIGWGTMGFIWGKPIYNVLVRDSRYTYEIIEQSNEFTVSFPYGDEMKSALTFCGTKSGRDMDKIAACNLQTQPAKTIAAPIILCKGIHLECKILYKNAMSAVHLDSSVDTGCYPKKDYHTMYFGEITGCYELA